MKYKTSINLGWLIILLSFIFRLIETWYFGWNTSPINVYEEWCDTISQIIFGIGLFYLFNPAFEFYSLLAVWLDDKNE